MVERIIYISSTFSSTSNIMQSLIIEMNWIDDLSAFETTKL